MHALLRHLETAGFTGAPTVVGNGFDDDGNEVVSFVEGGFVHPHAWSEPAIHELGALLRSFHDTAATFTPPPDAIWQVWFTRHHGPDAIVGHGDTGPWNVVARDGMPVAFIDWEFAGPVGRLNEVAQTAWLNAQLHDDDVAERQQLPDAEARAALLRAFLDGYGLPDEARGGFVDRMIHMAIRDCANEAIQAGTTPWSRDPEIAWALAWRARSAAWMVHQRDLLRRAVGERVTTPRRAKDRSRPVR